jgi:glycosyltransferase involved in cell wall biosynthesis
MAELTVLLVNKFFHDIGPAGGVGRYVLQEAEDLSALGWRVVPFAVADADARPTEWSAWFAPARDYSSPRWSSHAPADAAALLWNREAARRLDSLLSTARTDVAHVHNIYHHLSASLLPVLARHRVPVVMTLHDLRLLCPAIHMLRQGRVCERCRGGRFYEAVLGLCVKGSRAASLLAAVETANQHYRRLYPRHVRRFLCPSRFYLEKYAEWGYPRAQLQHLPNFVDTLLWRPASGTAPADPAYLYFGRISAEKGLGSLLAAQALWEREDAAAPVLRIAGQGPWDDELRRRVTALGLRRVEILGALAGPALREALARVRFTVIPSEWYENAPMALLESMAAGRPVAGAAIGGVPELIEDGRDGVLFPPGDPPAILAGLRRALALDPATGARAREKAERLWTRPAHMARLGRILVETAAGAAGARSA